MKHVKIPMVELSPVPCRYQKIKKNTATHSCEIPGIGGGGGLCSGYIYIYVLYIDMFWSIYIYNICSIYI